MSEPVSAASVAALARILSKYFDILDFIFAPIFPRTIRDVMLSAADAQTKGSIDERIAKIDAAKSNLMESLEALDELKAQAAANKEEMQRALLAIEQLEKQKTVAQTELNTLKSVSELDSSALKKLFNVPTSSRIWLERFYGLITGILASIIAAYVWNLFVGS